MKSGTVIRGEITFVVEGPSGKRVHRTTNLITSAGDIYYSQRMAGETPTNTFANLVLGSGSGTPAKNSTYSSITPIASTNKAVDSGYPKTNDSDADNNYAGQNVVTYKYYYGKADFNAVSISEGVITIASPSAGSPVLCYFKFANAFEKTENDTLTVFINHESEGVTV